MPRARMSANRIAQAITKRMPAKVKGGRSSRPSLMNSHVDPQIPQSTSQTRRAFTSRCFWFRLQHREHRGRRIEQNREPADSGNVLRGFHNSAAGVSRLSHRCVAVVHGEIDHPMWRNRTHLGSDLVHAADAFVAVLENGVYHWTRKRFPRPTKQCRIKVRGFLRIVCAELVPANSADFAIDSGSRILFRLPDSEDGAGRILNY